MSCRECNNYRSHINHLDSGIRRIAKLLCQKNVKNSEKLLVDLKRDKEELKEYKEWLEKHQIEHDLEELEKLDDESSRAN